MTITIPDERRGRSGKVCYELKMNTFLPPRLFLWMLAAIPVLVPAAEPQGEPAKAPAITLPQYLAFADFPSRYVITGTFGHPILSLFKVRGTVVETKGDYLRVLELDGRALPQPGALFLEKKPANTVNGQTSDFFGYETIEFDVPRLVQPEYSERYDIRQGATIDYRTRRIGHLRFVIVSADEPPKGVPNEPTKSPPPQALPFADFPSRYVLTGTQGRPLCTPFMIRGTIRAREAEYIDVLQMDGRSVAQPLRLFIGYRPLNVYDGETCTFVG